jgi:hypothetical protein
LEKASSIFGAIDRALKDLKLTTTTKLQARLEQAFLTSEKYFLIHKGTLEKVSSLLEERQYQRAFDILSKPNLAIYQIPRSETALPNNLAVLINREGSRSFRDLARVVETFAQKQTTEFYSQFFDLPSLSKEQVSTILDFRPSCFENDANIKAAIATVLVKVAAACIVGEAADKTNRNHFKRLLNYLTDQAGITGVRARGLEVLEICLAHEADTNPKFWSGGTLGHIDELRDMGFATWLIENDSRFKEIPLRYWENGKMAPKLASQVLLECCHGKLADACRGIANNHLENIRLDSVWDNQEFKDFAELRIFLDKNNIQTFGELHSFIRKIASLVSVDEKSALNSGGTGTSDEGASTDSESRRSADVEWGHVLELAPANWRDGVDTYAEEQRKKLVREHELQAELTARRLLEMEALRQHREFIRDSHTKQRGRDFER